MSIDDAIDILGDNVMASPKMQYVSGSGLCISTITCNYAQVEVAIALD